MMLQIDTAVRKIGTLLRAGNWSEASEKMWNSSALAVLCQFVQHNKTPDMAQHVVLCVLEEIACALPTVHNQLVFCVEPDNALGGHSLHLLLIPAYTAQYCALEVERLNRIQNSIQQSRAHSI